MNFNEIVSSVEELTIKIAALEKTVSNIKTAADSLTSRGAALENNETEA